MPIDEPVGEIVNLQTRAIYTRSPYFVTINEPGQVSAKIIMWIWRADQVVPFYNTYIREKLIPSSDNPTLLFNVSEFVNEYYQFTEPNYDFNVNFQDNPKNEWCYIKYSIYYQTDASPSFILKETKTFRAFYGWGTFNEGYNPDLGQVHLDSGTYYYYYPNNSPWPTNPLISQPKLLRYGSFRMILENGWQVKYTGLQSGSTITQTASLVTEKVKRTYLVYPTMLAEGCATEVLDASSNVLASFTMLPLEECRYEPIVCDFVNKYGAWQRTWFYKASRDTGSVTGQEYNLMARDIINYDIRIGQRQQFNVNGKDVVSCNTGWVDEEYRDVMQQLILSETIQINGQPAKCLTKSVEYMKHINQKLFSYKVDFEYAFDTINSLI